MIEHNDPSKVESDKYSLMWDCSDYRDAQSPGEENVERFLELLKPISTETLVDIGCGAGKAGLEFKSKGLSVWWWDITDNGLSSDVPRDRFIQQAIWQRYWRKWDYGYCCDVMEHIPTEYVMLSLDNMLRQCHTLYLSIALRPDVFGAVIGQPLHLTVRDFVWWRDRIATLGRLLEARDLCGDGLYIVERS